MQIFVEPNLSNNWKCNICNTSAVKPVILVPIVSIKDYNNQNKDIEAIQVHLECIINGLIFVRELNSYCLSVNENKE